MKRMDGLIVGCSLAESSIEGEGTSIERDAHDEVQRSLCRPRARTQSSRPTRSSS